MNRRSIVFSFPCRPLTCTCMDTLVWGYSWRHVHAWTPWYGILMYMHGHLGMGILMYMHAHLGMGILMYMYFLVLMYWCKDTCNLHVWKKTQFPELWGSISTSTTKWIPVYIPGCQSIIWGLYEHNARIHKSIIPWFREHNPPEPNGRP